jgi:hypothetical protein
LTVAFLSAVQECDATVDAINSLAGSKRKSHHDKHDGF